MIPVVWYNASLGNFDHGLLSSIFDKHQDHFVQFNNKVTPRPQEKQIVIVSHRPEIKELRTYLDSLPAGIVILCSEEDGTFDWKAAIPEHLEVFTQYYYAPTKSEIKTRLLLGAPGRIKDFKINSDLPKRYLWSFIGQVNNSFRQECVENLKTLPFGYLKVISGFGGTAKDAIDYQEYLDIMCQSEFVICPSGSSSADCFRIYESMETGATPIADKRSPRDAEDFNYWKEVYPENKLITVDNWKDFDLNLYNTSENLWWNKYKTEFEEKLIAYAK